MAFQRINKRNIVASTPEELLNDLKTRKIKGLIAHHADILRAYYAQHGKESDIAIQLPTGSGKTLVGLVIAEWRRRKYSERVVYLCPTRQLVHQAVKQARDKYGLSPIGFIGKIREYPNENKTAYSRAEAVAITNYSSFFCQPTFFSDAQVVILDDIHSADNYIANVWSLEINKYNSEHRTTFDLLAGVLRKNLSHSDYARIIDKSEDDTGMEWVEKIPTPVFYKLIPEIIDILDDSTKSLGLRYDYKADCCGPVWSCHPPSPRAAFQEPAFSTAQHSWDGPHTSKLSR